MDGNVENVDVSGGHVSMNRHTVYQNNGMKPLINPDNSDDIDIRYDLKNGYASHGTGLIKSHNISI